jgi:parvulin-like peptidyl-prolyl isomerase
LRRASFALCCSSLLLLPQLASAKLVDRVVAVVNDEIILDSELELFTAPNLRNPVDLDTTEGQKLFDTMKRKYLDRLIESRLIAQQAADLKLSVTSDEVDRAIEEVKHQNNIDDAAFAEALKGQGFTMEAYRKNLKKQILELKVINTAVRSRVSVSEEEVKTAYHQSDRQYAGERLAHLREIVLLVPKDASSELVEKKRGLAARILSEAQGGHRPFKELAKAYSEADSKAEGGDLGFVQAGSLVDALGEVVRTMDPGDVRGPIRTAQGFSVLELVEWKSGNLKPYDEVKDQLKRQLYDQQVEKATASWVKELRKRAHVDIR